MGPAGCIIEAEPTELPDAESPASSATPVPTSPPQSPTAGSEDPTQDPTPDPTPNNTETPTITPAPSGSACGSEAVDSSNHWPSYQIPDGLQGTGHEVGDVVPNFTLKDQFGQEVSLHQFYGMAIMIEIGTAWCTGCIEGAATSQALLEHYSDACVTFITVLFQNPYGSPPTTSDLKKWADTYGIDYPILGDGAQKVSADFDVTAIPQYYFIDRQMILSAEINQYPGEAALQKELDLLL